MSAPPSGPNTLSARSSEGMGKVQVHEAVEQGGGLGGAFHPVQGVCQPEGTSKERALLAGNAVHVGAVVADRVTHHQSLTGQVPLDGVHGADHARIGPGREPVTRHQ